MKNLLVLCLALGVGIAAAPDVASAKNQTAKNCPPGLANKSPRCVPPGLAKKGVTLNP